MRPALEATEKALARGLIIEAEQQARHKRTETLRAEVEAGADEAPGPDVVGCVEHRALAEEIRARIAQARER